MNTWVRGCSQLLRSISLKVSTSLHVSFILVSCLDLGANSCSPGHGQKDLARLWAQQPHTSLLRVAGCPPKDAWVTAAVTVCLWDPGQVLLKDEASSLYDLYSVEYIYLKHMCSICSTCMLYMCSLEYL